MKFMLVGVFLSVVHFATITTSFTVFSPFAPSRQQIPHSHQKSNIEVSLSAQQRISIVNNHVGFSSKDLQLASLGVRQQNSKLWLSDSNNSPSEETDDTTNDSIPKGNWGELEQFLKDQGKETEEEARKRKRDVIKEFMTRNSTETKAAPVPIQPIRVEDGKVDEELVKQQQEDKSRVRVQFDKVFKGLPSLEEIISRDPSEREVETDDSDGTKKGFKRKKTYVTDDENFAWFEPERRRIEEDYEKIRQQSRERIRAKRQQEEDLFWCQVEAWNQTSREFGFGMPTLDDIASVTMFTPEDAVTELIMEYYPMEDFYDNDEQDAKDDAATGQENDNVVADAIVGDKDALAMEEYQQDLEKVIETYESALFKTTEEFVERYGVDSLFATEEEDENDDEEGFEELTPDNAESIADALITQEMNQMIDQVLKERSRERFMEFQKQESAKSKKQDYMGATDDVVDQIFKETAENWEQSEKLKAQENEYEKYVRMREQQSIMEASQKVSLRPEEGKDLDQWTLDRLEEMLKKAKSQDNENLSITDILEENIEDLQKQIEKESRKGSVEPQTMKEWQMYRSIATKLAEGEPLFGNSEQTLGSLDNSQESSSQESAIDDTQVDQQLDSWRDFLAREEIMRKQVNLYSSPNLAYNYLGPKVDEIEALKEEELALEEEESQSDRLSQREFRRKINQQAVEAMEALIKKSDGRRAAGLKLTLESLKEDLEESDFYDMEEDNFEEQEEDKASKQPVDLADVFGMEEEEEIPRSRITAENIDTTNQNPMNTGNAFPATPDFTNDLDSNESEYKAPAPNTPFFQDQVKDEDINAKDNKLGSAEEQRLKALFRQKNVRSETEQDAIRKNFEDYQNFEKEIREKSGLGMDADSDASSLLEDVQVDYDVKDIVNEDGDFDAEKILSTIGPRPKRKEKPPPSEIDDAIYRSVAASGDGRGKYDEALGKKDRADFDAFMEAEREMKKEWAELGNERGEGDKLIDVDIDDPEYVEENLDPRPFVRARKKELLREQELSDSGEVDANLEDEYDDSYDDAVDDSDDSLPDWLQNERRAPKQRKRGTKKKLAKKKVGENRDAFLGSDTNDGFDNDGYDRRERQAQEYQQQRKFERRGMGIDISDALGRRGLEYSRENAFNDEYTRSQQDEFDQINYESRKAKYMDYIELDPSQLNNLMAYKESADSSGASQYLPRINKPLKEFGAIFRLEGVLVDITGMQQKVWNRVAAEIGLKEPRLEYVKRAATLKPDAAIREMFYTVKNDIVLVRRIHDAYLRIFRVEFDSWAREVGLGGMAQNKAAAGTRRSFALGFDYESDSSVTVELQKPVLSAEEEKRRKFLKEIWTKTAKQFGFPTPTNEQIDKSTTLTPEIAVRDIFHWSEDSAQINKIVVAYSMLQGGTNVSPEDETVASEQAEPQELSGADILVCQKSAWNKTAEVFNFVPPSEKMILSVSGLSAEDAAMELLVQMYDPDEVAPEDQEEFEILLDDAIDMYEEELKASVNTMREKYGLPPILDVEVPEPVPMTIRSVPSQELSAADIMACKVTAWKKTSQQFDFEPPSEEQILSVNELSAEDSAMELLVQMYDPDEVAPEDEKEYELLLNDAIDMYEEELKASMNTMREKYGLPPILEEVMPEMEAEKSGATPVIDTSGANQELSAADIMACKVTAWKKTSQEFEFEPPSEEQILSVNELSAEDAAMELLIQKYDPDEVAPEDQDEFEILLNDAIDMYEEELKSSVNTMREKYGLPPVLDVEVPKPTPKITPTYGPKALPASDMLLCKTSAWKKTAEVFNFEPPSEEQILSVNDLVAEEAAMELLIQKYDPDEVAPEDQDEFEILLNDAIDMYEEKLEASLNNMREKYGAVEESIVNIAPVSKETNIEKEDLPLVTIMPGVAEWIRSLQAAEIGCGVVTHLEDDQLNTLLKFAQLSDVFATDKRVSSSNGYLRDGQQFLGASLRIERRPDQCVVFESSPAACDEAREYDMRSVARLGAYPRFELTSADTTVSSVSELTAFNIRRLFGERINDEVETETAQPWNKDTTVKTKTTFKDYEDEEYDEYE